MAAFDKKEARFKEGKEIVSWLARQNEFKVVITNLIFAEIANHLQNRIRHICRDKMEEIKSSPRIDILFDDQDSMDTGFEIFKQYDEIGYVDAITVFYFKRLRCKYIFSFDSGFDAIKGITRLISPPTF